MYLILTIHTHTHIGLPPQCTHIKTDLAIVCNIGILSLRIWLKSGRDIELRESIDIYLQVLERGQCSGSCNSHHVVMSMYFGSTSVST